MLHRECQWCQVCHWARYSKLPPKWMPREWVPGGSNLSGGVTGFWLSRGHMDKQAPFRYWLLRPYFVIKGYCREVHFLFIITFYDGRGHVIKIEIFSGHSVKWGSQCPSCLGGWIDWCCTFHGVEGGFICWSNWINMISSLEWLEQIILLSVP